MKNLPALLLFGFYCAGGFVQQSPDKLYGPLFQDVEMHEVFPDQKTFVDCVAIRKPSEIMAEYQRLLKEPGFDLKAFVARNFIRPPDRMILQLTSRGCGKYCVEILQSPWKEVPYCRCPIRTLFPAAGSMRFITGTRTSRCWD